MVSAVRLQACVVFAVLALGLVAEAWAGPAVDLKKLQLRYATRYVGNSFAGAGENGRGEWVQQGVQEIEVTPNGVVVAGSSFDEAGRCVGLYRDGKVNTRLVQQYDGKGGHKTNGWGTANYALAVVGKEIFVANTVGDLMRFTWDGDDSNSVRYDSQVKVAGRVHGLAANGQTLALCVAGRVEIRNQSDLSTQGQFDLAGASDVAFAGDGSLWILAGKKVVHRSAQGKELPGELADAVAPSSVSVSPDGRLVVCDDGPDQQVLVYEIADQPRLVQRMGQKGGIRAGTPGQVAADKFFGLRGAAFDAKGNLYVGLGIPHRSVSCLRSFDPQGKLLWELWSLAFVDCYGFDPRSDGSVLYGIDEIIDVDLSTDSPARWSPRAITLDASSTSRDPRMESNKGHPFASTWLRWLDGRRLLYTTGQWAGGFHFFTFDQGSELARPAGSFRPDKGSWAWQVDSAGTIWWGNAPGRKIHAYPFQGWSADGLPQYDQAQPQRYDRPELFVEVARLHYAPATDSLYISGYTKDKKSKSWGLAGSVLARYDGWCKGERRLVWQVDLPVDDEMLHPKSLDIAGEYIFTVQVKPTQGKSALVTVFRVKDGQRVGVMYPGPEVGGNCGWVDIPYGIQAMQRADGEYLVLVEEDWRAKMLLYRWRPEKG